MREERDDRGFTLIELMVVMATIGILVAIVIPRFTRVQNLTYDRTAQESLVTAGGVEVGFYTLQGKYLDVLVDLQNPKTGEPSINWKPGTTPTLTAGTPRQIFVYLAPSGPITAFVSTESVTGTCYYLQVPIVAPPSYATDAACGAADTRTYVASW